MKTTLLFLLLSGSVMAQSKVDSLECQLSDAYYRIERIEKWVYEVEKEGRRAEWYATQDHEKLLAAQIQFKHTLDSLGKKEPRLRTICKAIGDLVGSMTGLNAVGRIVK